MITLKKRPLLSKPKAVVADSDSEEEQADKKRLPVVSKNFKIPWRKGKIKNDSADFFVLDTVGDTAEASPEPTPSADIVEESCTPKPVPEPAPIQIDENVQKTSSSSLHPSKSL
ncbi:hypothetical protein OESDEN_06851 [Oesophagostomum dentatum]|uniref:Uncharacterized protein n=1 Tax=Oesophagostomum dentatum TaxID=61180 RepID=A0A0B1TD09_OESDE|nr:hypothetical protein OESDEN_06851 [Oesophagostomum dentatum]